MTDKDSTERPPGSAAAAPTTTELLYRLIESLPSETYNRLVRRDPQMLAWWKNADHGPEPL